MIVIPLVLCTLGTISWVKNRKKGEFTPERMAIYNAAMNGALKDPERMDTLAKAFEKEGLRQQGKLLRQRAKLMRLPDAVKEARRAIWRKAIKSKNKKGVLMLAVAYDKEGCTKAALRLREYASGLPENIPDPVVPASPAPEHAAEPAEHDAAGQSPPVQGET